MSQWEGELGEAVVSGEHEGEAVPLLGGAWRGWADCLGMQPWGMLVGSAKPGFLDSRKGGRA